MLRHSVSVAVAACGILGFAGEVSERDVSLAGEGWRFAKDSSFVLQAEAERFDDSKWQKVRVPHDWAISGPFDLKAKDGHTGKLPWKGVGWYRRNFTLDASEAKAEVFIDFDGVMASPEVYVNGQKAGGWDYGYASFRVDATPFVRFGGANTLAVRADTRRMGSRWYPGAGIYRKVVMKVRARSHFAHNGIFVTTPEVSAEKATVKVAWELEGPLSQEMKVGVAIVRDDGAKVGGGEAKAIARSLAVQLDKPALWSVDSPRLHWAEVSLIGKDGSAISQEKVRFGVRRIAFPTPTEEPAKSKWAENGFHLNGKRVQLKGVNLHSDLGPLGMAFDKSAMRRQLMLMKEMGANALRTSHNPPAPEVLDLCDELGILVWDECFDSWGASAGRYREEITHYVSRNLREFVRRDRNHPSVIVWSMSNEIVEDGHCWDKDGIYRVRDGLTRERCAKFREAMLIEDSTRPIGNGNKPTMAYDNIIRLGIFDDLDILGWNYGASYRLSKKWYPTKPVVYTESASAFSTYGHYERKLPPNKNSYDKSSFQTSGYDFTCGPDIPDREFARMESDVYCCGEFVWTGIDYLGEPWPFEKEARSSYFGIADLMGIPKDRYWLYRSHWNEKDETMHIVPHWTWPGRECETVPVFVYTSGEKAELFLNGRSMGMRRKGEFGGTEKRPEAYYDDCARYRLMWLAVPYEPGELRVVAYRGGKRIGEKAVRTAGKSVRLVATVEGRRSSDPDELMWIQVDATDAHGVRDPNTMRRVNFELTGPGEILGVGNGDATAYEPFTKTDSHPMFYGKVVAVVRRNGSGELIFKASSKDLTEAKVRLPDWFDDKTREEESK